MSRHSAEIPWWWTEGRTSFYYWGKKNGGVIEEIHLASPLKLSAIIHEINECEIVNLLIDKFADETKGITTITITTKIMIQIVKNFGHPLIFNGINEQVYVSHMISPYATGNCFMPRRKYRVFW